MFRVLITLVLSLTVSVSAWAGNWNRAIPDGYELNITPHKHGFRYTTDGEPTRRGEVAERFEVRHGDCGGSDCKSPRYRSEINLKAGKTIARFNEDIWYGWSYFNESIPAFEDKVNLMPVVGQWKMGGDAHPIFKFTYHGYRKRIEVQLDDMMTAKKWGKEKKYGHVCSLIPLHLTKNIWTDFVVNTNFGTDKNGYLRVWVDGVLKCDYTGQLVANKSKKLFPGPNHRRGIFVSYTKRWDKVQPNVKKPTMIAYYDEFMVGRSRIDVDTRLREQQGLAPKD